MISPRFLTHPATYLYRGIQEIRLFEFNVGVLPMDVVTC
jgi:hypothetical protein